MFKGFYQGKRVLVTGHTGFKGSWLSLWLHRLGAEVTGFALEAPTTPSFHEAVSPGSFTREIHGDIRNLAALETAVKETQPEMVFHLAAQALVRRSYAEPLDTLTTNAIGTAKLLEAVCRSAIPCTVVVVTSDKCYENREWDFSYRENDPLGGHDVYSMSKAATEMVAASWNRSFFLPNPRLGHVVTARAGNVLGGGDYAEDRIVPDCVRALMAGEPIPVRNPGAVRPWQHVLECLSGYLWLGARLGVEPKGSRLVTPFNFGPEPSARQSVRQLVEEVLQVWPGAWKDLSQSTQGPHEAKLLSLSIDKASALLGWRPAWGFSTSVRAAMNWYRERHVAGNPRLVDYTCGQIDDYTAAAQDQGIAWAVGP